ncbi:hypothetical protein ACGGAI_21035 [Streptomyces antibioticus]|uniref:hypothetical protein n=1 Tax=Streptomyces antibioticus TaxID=1890 RepID=UPI0037246341
MGWENVRTKTGLSWGKGMPSAAAAAGAAQLPVAILLWWFQRLDTEDYGLMGPSWGLACLAVFAPLYLPILGLAHACAQTLPALTLARTALRPLPRPEWVRHLLGTALVAVAWAGVAFALWGLPFVTTAVALTALGVLPVLAVHRTGRRPRGSWGIWWRAGAASVALSVLTVLGGILATATGLIEEYEPPELSADRLAGVWRGADGAELLLRPGGRAELTGIPADEPGSYGEVIVCEGTGSWALGRADDHARRDAVLLRIAAGSGTGSGCGDELTWTISGTDRAPELFAVLGDPDAGDVRILERASS